MDVNVGRNDQIFRFVSGAILGALAVNAVIDKCIQDYFAPLFGVIAVALIVTGYTRKCGMLDMMDTDTLENEEDN